MWRTLLPVDHVDPGMSDADEARRPLLGAAQAPPPDPDEDAQPRGTLEAPDLRGMAASDARRIGRMSDLRVAVSTRSTEEALWGRVVAQEPAPGAAMWPGDAVAIILGTRPDVVVPDVRGAEEAEALAVLRDAGLHLGRRVARRSDRAPEGHVVRTRPRAGATVPMGTRVTCIVATPRAIHGAQARRHEKRVRRLPDGAFLSLPSVE